MDTPEVRRIPVGPVGVRQAAWAAQPAAQAAASCCERREAEQGPRSVGGAAARSLALREASRVGGRWGCLDVRNLAW